MLRHRQAGDVLEEGWGKGGLFLKFTFLRDHLIYNVMLISVI